MCSKQISCRRTTPTLLADDEGRGGVCRALRSGAVGDGQPAMALEPSGRAEHVVQDERNVQNVSSVREQERGMTARMGQRSRLGHSIFGAGVPTALSPSRGPFLAS
jgi:hypothetical protein